ncbi:MAG: hypothetical protein IT379_11655 [Deltaproteobacteria bacterium]|nr:hypothetical protein [Deltaproteobacteria bacterium]
MALVAAAAVAALIGLFPGAIHARRGRRRGDGRAAPAATRGLWLDGLRHAHHASEGARHPLAVVHATSDVRGDHDVLDVVVVFHGWSSCASNVMGWHRAPCGRQGGNLEVARRLDAIGLPLVAIVPQLAFEERTGDPGRFAYRGVFPAFVDEVLERSAPLLGRAPGAPRPRVGKLVLAAHSAGYATLAAVLRAGAPESLRAVVLLDSLYGHEDVFASYAARPGARLYVVSGRSTREETETLAEMISARIRFARSPSSANLRALPMLVRSTLGHEDIARIWLGPIVRAALAD